MGHADWSGRSNLHALPPLFSVWHRKLQNLDRGDELADVPLTVVCAVDQKTANRSRQLLLPDVNRFMEAIRRDGADAVGRSPQPGAKLVEDLGDGAGVQTPRIEFALESIQLSRAELFAFRVREQAVQRADDVAQMKDDGRKTRGTIKELVVAQSLAPVGGIFAAEIQGMEDAATDGIDVVVGATQPRLGEGGFLHQGPRSTPS